MNSKDTDAVIGNVLGCREGDLTLEQLLKSGLSPAQVLNEALAMREFSKEDLGIFDAFTNIRGVKKNIFTLEKEFEVFLKIAGVLQQIPEEDCIDAGLLQKSTVPFKDFSLFSKAKNVLLKNSGDTRLSILAYLICFDWTVDYTGEFEVFYILDYQLKGKGKGPLYKENTEQADSKEVETEKKEVKRKIIQEDFKDYRRMGKIAISWAQNSKVEFQGSLFSLDCKDFFQNELLYLKNFDALAKVIALKKSHKLFYNRLSYIMKNVTRTSPEKEYLSMKGLLTLLVESFDPTGEQEHLNETLIYENVVDEAPVHQHKCSNASLIACTKDGDNSSVAKLSRNLLYTEKILLKIQSDSLTKKFILETKTSLGCFFHICHVLDPLFFQCMNICINNFDKIPPGLLNRVLSSKKFKVDTLQGFEKVFKTICESQVPVPIPQLLAVGSSDISKPLSNKNKQDLLSRISIIFDTLTVPNELIQEFVSRAISWNHPEQSLRLIFKIQSLSIFKSFMRKSRADIKYVINELKREDTSVFHYQVARILKKAGLLSNDVLMSILSPETCNPFCQVVLKKLMCVSSPLAIDNISGIAKNNLEKDRSSTTPLLTGIYFSKGHLTISDLYKKFFIAVQLSIYKIDLANTVLFAIDSLSLEIRDGILALIEKENANTFGPAIEFALQGNHVVTFNILIKYEGKALEITVNSKSIIIFQKTVQSLTISEKFRGILQHLVYIETTEMKPVNPEMTEMEVPVSPGTSAVFKTIFDYTNSLIVPIHRLLLYKSRKGLLVNGKRPVRLGKPGEIDFVKLKNVLFYDGLSL